VCLHRTTIAGRNFEYFSEDPYLTGVMGVAVAKAIQAHDVIAMAKHYVVNDQEYERFRASVEVDEYVLRELYLLPVGCRNSDVGCELRIRVEEQLGTVTLLPVGVRKLRHVL
jgi:hypothetical protein